MSRIICHLEGEDVVELPDLSVTFTAKAAIDTDGSGPLHGDPCAQADTSLHHHGKALNADTVAYIVVPPAIILGVRGIVLGCQAKLKNLRNGRECFAVVGDIGPKTKLGEISVKAALELGLPASPISGGVDEHIIQYTLWPGVAAIVEPGNDQSLTYYKLQPYRA